MKNTAKLLWGSSYVASAALLVAAYLHLVPLQLMEVLGFVSGGYCVWLTVRENIWNWPIGILNAAAFGVLFVHSRLYADAGLQAVYVVLGVLGWYWWLKGGQRQTALTVSHIGRKEAAALSAIGIIASYWFVGFLGRVGDIAPLWDGITTVTSLIAQYMLTRKYFENWFVWIATDCIYVALYGFKHLALTAVLYAIFLGMCFIGVRDWRQAAQRQANHIHPATTKLTNEAEA